MNLAEMKDCLNPHAICKNALVSRIFKILEACEYSKNLIIGIYLIEQKHFLYCNRRLKNILGKDYVKLMEGGWDFLFSRIDPNEAIWVRDRMTNFFVTPYSLDTLTIRYHITNFEGNRIYIRHEILLHKIDQFTLAINYFFDVSDKERIEGYFDSSKKTNKSKFYQKMQYNISTREKEVLHLIANGYSSKEIADMLFISNHTAISHRKNLIEKFQVKNTAHLIKKAAGFICL